MSLQLGFASSDQVRTFTTELMQEFDRNQNSWLEFDEFRKLYTMYLSDEMARKSLKTRVQVRFQSEEQLQALAEERAMAQRRAKLRCELEARREANHAIKERQRAKFANLNHLNHLDYNRLNRQGGAATNAIVQSSTTSNWPHEELYSFSRRLKATMRRRRRTDVRRNCRLCLSMTREKKKTVRQDACVFSTSPPLRIQHI